jgi:hypothetical protein
MSFDEKILDLIMQRMDDHKEESNRRFDSLSKDVSDIKSDVKSISQWRVKIATGIVISGFAVTLVFKICEIGIRYILK